MTSTNKTTEKDNLDFARLIGELIDHYKLIIAITTLFMVIAISYAIFSTPIYQSDALIQVEQKQGNAILSNLSQLLPDGQLQSAPEIALLQSRMIIGKTVDDLNLQIKVQKKYFPIFGRGWSRITNQEKEDVRLSKLYIPLSNEESKSVELTVLDNEHYKISGENFSYNGMVGEQINNKNIIIDVDEIKSSPGTSFEISYTSKLKVITELQKSFVVSDQGKDTGILNLSMEGDNPELIEKILNNIAQNYLSQNVARQAAQDEKSLKFLDKQLPIVRNDLDIAEGKLNQYRRKNDSVDLSLEAKSVLDQIVNVDNQLNELTFREAEISQLYTKEHPTYKALNEKKQTLKDERDKLNKRVSGMPGTQQEILRLSRDVESGRAVYMQLLNRQQELNIAKSSAIGNVRIIDNAETQLKPVKPKKVLIVLCGLLLGSMMSSCIIFLKIYLRRGIETPEELEEVGINVYASIPIAEKYLKNKKKLSIKKGKNSVNNEFLLEENPADLAIEAIRGLRTSLHFAMMDAKNNVLMMSGASPAAGKSFISTNLSGVVAQTGKRVLLIDADMRKGYTHELFNSNNKNGLSDYLSGRSQISDLIKQTAINNFDFISRGVAPPNPAELLMHERFEALIKWASGTYDIVVIDTPPILAVTDAAIIARYVGTTLLVARFEYNTVKEMEVSIRRFNHGGIEVKGCILNGVLKKSSTYYGYGYSNYDYSYKR
ncbi:polysaccharide biosynthesis tyrosine autokinase [Pluralibacter gergoviae]|uniref:polysaccharide biosynthesis tyrosine autokinase n=1 Tax=Pluralibacter gergoviae TaxID=61647 RepID=UPI00330E02D0|nr:polysaccharide biosynthesis tyrosine autokinase [Pluralibacter gergoviae]